jgi:hypothetical protein
MTCGLGLLKYEYVVLFTWVIFGPYVLIGRMDLYARVANSEFILVRRHYSPRLIHTNAIYIEFNEGYD